MSGNCLHRHIINTASAVAPTRQGHHWRNSFTILRRNDRMDWHESLSLM